MNVLVCSHLLRDVEEVCDEVVILKDGGIVHHANLEVERRENRRFVELEVAGNDGLLAGTLRESGGETVNEGAGRWRIVLPPGVGFDLIWRAVAHHNLEVRKLTHRHDTLEEIFLKAVGHIERTPGQTDQPLEVATYGRL
jgi:ABC-2 type transport system ATP-binding protein